MRENRKFRAEERGWDLEQGCEAGTGLLQLDMRRAEAFLLWGLEKSLEHCLFSACTSPPEGRNQSLWEGHPW